jgi:SPP1 gp7 family putative phage head morphogenesis protein
MSEGLYLPSRLVEELAEKKYLEAVRREHDSAITFHDSTLNIGGLAGSTGTAFADEDLLKEVKGWIAVGLRAITDRLSGLTVAAYIRSDTPEEHDPLLPPSHPANEILFNPNPIFSFPLMLGLMGAWVKITGNAYFQILHDGAGVPRELWPMPPDRVKPVASHTDVIGGYNVLGPNGREIRLERHEVLRVWRPDPAALYQSQGDLAPQADEYNAERFRVGHVKSTFENDATPRAVLEMDSEAPAPQPGEAESWRLSWKELNHRRKGSHTGVPAILPPGFKIHEMGMNSDGSSTVALGIAARDHLLASMGVPGSIVGLVTDVNRASADTNQFTFDKNTVKPIVDLFTGALTQQLAPQFDARIVYKFAKFVAPDKEFDLRQEQSDLTNKVIVVNEVRRKRGLDDADWGDLPVGSFNEVPYTGDEDFGLESVSDLEDPRSRLTRSEDRAVVTDDMKKLASPDYVWKRVVANERKYVAKFARAMGVVFAGQADVVVKRLHAALPLPTPRQITRGVRISVDDLFFNNEFAHLYEVSIKRLRELIFTENGESAFSITDPDGEFRLTSRMREHLERIHADMVTKVDKHTKNLITRELIKGTSKGESADQLAKRLKSRISNRKRARTIARTEVGKAVQLAQVESFAQSGVVEKKQWNTSRDSFVRDSHSSAHGQIVDLDDLFRLGSGALAVMPYDPSLPAGDIVNCRCFVTPVFVNEGEGG